MRGWNHETQVFLDSLTDEQREGLKACLVEHERDLDYSDGTSIVLDESSDLMRDAEYSCCGWHESRYVVGGHVLVLGTCYGH